MIDKITILPGLTKGPEHAWNLNSNERNTMAAKVVKIGRGRTRQMDGQKTNNDHGNMPKKKKVVIPKSRKYKKAPPPPKYLSEHSRKYWRDHASGLVKNNRLNLDTREAFEVLSAAWGRWRDWVEMMAEFRAADPGMRGLIWEDGATTRTTPSGTKVEKGGMVKVSIPAEKAEKAEAHFYRLLSAFSEISAQYEEKSGGRNKHALYDR